MLSRNSRSLSPVRSPTDAVSSDTRQPRPPLPTSHFRTRSKSLKATIVRTLKSSITKNTKSGKALYEQSKPVLDLFVGDESVPTDLSPTQVRAAVTLLYDMQKTAHRLGSLQRLIDQKFNDPQVLKLPECDALYAEVLEAHKQAGVDHVSIDLNYAIGPLRAALLGVNATLIPFIPTPSESDDGDDSDVTAAIGGASNSTLIQVPTHAPISPLSSVETPILGRQVNGSLSGMISDNMLDYQHQLSVSEDATKHLQKRMEVLSEEHFAQLQELRQKLREKRESEYYQSQQLVSLEKELELVRFQESQARRLLDEEINLKVAQALQKQFALEDSALRRNAVEHVTTRCDVSPVPISTESFLSGFPPKSSSHLPTSSVSAAPITVLSTHAPVDRHQPPAQSNLDMQQFLLAFEKRMEGLLSNYLDSARTHVIESKRERVRFESEESDFIQDYEHDLNDEALAASGMAPVQQAPHREVPLVPTRSDSSGVHVVSSLKLESKLKMLPHFDGSTDFDEFMDTMQTTVFSQPLTADDKLFLLKNHLRGSARNCIAPSRVSTTALDKTLATLHKVYGKRNSRQQLLQQLQKLPFHQTSSEQMRSDLAALSGLVERMHDKGFSVSDENTSWILVRKLPEHMVVNLSRFMRKLGDDVTHLQILDRISEEVESLAVQQNIMEYSSGGDAPAANEIPSRFAFLNPVGQTPQSAAPAGQPSSYPRKKHEQQQLAYIPSQHPAHYFDEISNSMYEAYYGPGPRGVNPQLVSLSFPSLDAEDTECPVCHGPHDAIRCPLSSSEFRSISKTNRLCPLCLNNHDITECRSEFRCGYCDGLHHMGGCTLKEHFRDKKNYPAGAGKPKTF